MENRRRCSNTLFYMIIYQKAQIRPICQLSEKSLKREAHIYEYTRTKQHKNPAKINRTY